MRRAGAVFFAVMLASASVHAEPTEAEREEARAQFKKGAAAAKAEDWTVARDAFAAANRIAPHPVALMNLATAHYQLGEYVAALRALDDFEALAAPDAKQRPEAERLRKLVEPGIVTLDVYVSPESAAVQIDGVQMPDLGDHRTWSLDPGVHRLQVLQRGYESYDSTFMASPGETVERRLRLMEVAPATASEPKAAPKPTEETEEEETAGSGRSLLPWLIGGAGAAALVGGVVTGTMTNSKFDDVDAKCPGPECAGQRSEIDSGRSLQLITNVLLIGGGALLAAGAVLYFMDPGDADQSAAVQWTPACGPDGCGMHARGRF